MAMKKLHYACLLLALLPAWLYGQFDEFGTFMGVSAYSGDLSERHIEPLELNFAAGIYVRKKLTKHASYKIFGYRGFISGNDAHATVESGLWVRNLRFESEIYELGGVIEYSLLNFKNDFYTGSPYVFLGISGFHFNPITDMKGKKYALHVYQTEGVEYSLFQMAIPFGAGIKIGISQHGCLGLEAGFRKTFTDYLDDVSSTYADFSENGLNRGSSLRLQLSYRTPEILDNAPEYPQPGTQRGNPDKNDWFMYFGITLGVYLK